MTYRVIYGPVFRDDLRDRVRRMREDRVSQDVMDQWYGRLFDLIDSLNQWPRRFPIDRFLTRETGRETRKLNFGRYLVSYQIDEERRQVNLTGFVHGASRKSR